MRFQTQNPIRERRNRAGSIRPAAEESAHSPQLFCNITLYMHYNAVQAVPLLGVSVMRGKSELNHCEIPAKLKHSYYIES
jgi:hypothetical protein